MIEEDNRKFKTGDYVRFITLDGEEKFGTVQREISDMRPDFDIYPIPGYYTIDVEVKGTNTEVMSDGLVLKECDYTEGHAEIPEENITLYSEWHRENKIKQVLGE